MKNSEFHREKLMAFQQEKIDGREEIREKAIKVIENLNPIALHQFGSGGRNEGDEFSDVDLFATFEDKDLEEKVNNRLEAYSQVAPVLIRLYETKPNPAGWYHDLIIHDTSKGLFHVDYYMTPRSQVVLPPNAKLINGEDLKTEGEWSIPGDSAAGHDLLDGILAMSYIGVKGVVRKWDSGFFEWLKNLYNSYKKDDNPHIKDLPTEYNIDFVDAILTNLEGVGTESQQHAQRKIYAYLKKVQELYL